MLFQHRTQVNGKEVDVIRRMMLKTAEKSMVQFDPSLTLCRRLSSM